MLKECPGDKPMKDSKTNTQKAGEHKVCPWWMAYFFDNPLRRLIHPPEKVLGPHVSRGASVLDFGFGHYSLGMARLTGASGHVVAADVQQKMLDKTMERARKAGLDEIIRPLLCETGGIRTTSTFDFVLACNSLHEVPDPASILSRFFALLRPGGTFLLMEPAAHLTADFFEAEVALAGRAGFTELQRPAVRRQFTCLMKRPKVNP
jgi:ubiquinone/menaquinone biosynthesis C-methylase UbiE